LLSLLLSLLLLLLLLSDVCIFTVIAFTGPLNCNKWDCNCTFTRQRGCCCAANDMYELENETFMRMKYLWHQIEELAGHVEHCTAAKKIAFKATINPDIAVMIPGTTDHCFGPFNSNVPIPYGIVALNHGNGYNPSLGIFTAPRGGVYVFSFTVYSSVSDGQRLYHKVQLMKDGDLVSGVWENNREDSEDSATQRVILEMEAGCQVYLELVSGRKLCSSLELNIFTGYMLYPLYNSD
uniref:Cerebellin 18 n=1 Tax=Sphaeramia orbicularis TaxID=375764 RepID=A0A672Z298_9TELE